MLTVAAMPTAKTLLLNIFVNIILTRMQLPALHGISLNVFGLWIYLTLMNSCVINTLNSVRLQEHLPLCNALIFYPLILRLLP